MVLAKNLSHILPQILPKEDVRVDGRGRKDVRPIVFETELVMRCSRTI